MFGYVTPDVFVLDIKLYYFSVILYDFLGPVSSERMREKSLFSEDSSKRNHESSITTLLISIPG